MARILIVDDEMEVRRTFSTMLTRKGHEVVTAGNIQLGIEALQQAKMDSKPYQTVLIDLCFENFDGTEKERENAGMQVLDEAIKDPFLEPIIMTAFPSIPTAREAVAKGVFRYLIKGDTTSGISDLMEAVRLSLEHHRCIHDLAISIEHLEGSIKKTAPTSRMELELCVTLARQSYFQIMRLRGRKL